MASETVMTRSKEPVIRIAVDQDNISRTKVLVFIVSTFRNTLNAKVVDSINTCVFVWACEDGYIM